MPIVERMLASRDTTVRTVGARRATALYLLKDEGSQLAERALAGDPAMRIGAAQVYSANLSVPLFRERCAAALSAFSSTALTTYVVKQHRSLATWNEARSVKSMISFRTSSIAQHSPAMCSRYFTHLRRRQLNCQKHLARVRTVHRTGWAGSRRYSIRGGDGCLNGREVARARLFTEQG
jgi:hypothetical protein